MNTHHFSLHTCDYCSGSEPLSCNVFWDEWNRWLKPHILAWLYSYNLPRWFGQEQDIANDVLQVTFERILKYAKRSVLTGSRTIESLESFGMTVARNYIRDMWRKEYRLIPFTTLSESPENTIPGLSLPDPSELALSHLMSRDALVRLAHLINDFPAGQRRAILIDLAQRSDFDEETGPLHIIFLDVGINLYEYKLTRPLNALERSRHSALLSIAYKRLRQEFWTPTGDLVA
jgi:DNA-directed RNA polymerase specialized sigma24 family protein